jgi:hypothetical protein
MESVKHRRTLRHLLYVIHESAPLCQVFMQTIKPTADLLERGAFYQRELTWVNVESVIETKAITVLKFIQGLRGDLRVTFEEETWAAWLYAA